MMSSCRTSGVRSALIAVVVACGSGGGAAAPRELAAPWAHPVDDARAATEATNSKALACLDAVHDTIPSGALANDMSPAIIGAMFEVHAAHHPEDVGSDALLAFAAGAFWLGAQAARQRPGRSRHLRSARVADALDPGAPAPDSDNNAIVDLVRAGRLDDARRAYASYDARGGFGKYAEWSTVVVLGGLGRTADALAFIAAQPSSKRVYLDSQLIDGVLLAAEPVPAIDKAVAALMHDTGGDPASNDIALSVVAGKIRGHGLASHAQPIRHYLTSYIGSSSDAITLEALLAPEVLAAGAADEQRELDALATKLDANKSLGMRWARAYYRGTVADALAVTREHEFAGDRSDELYRLWGRAALEGYDPATLRAIDDLACAPR